VTTGHEFGEDLHCGLVTSGGVQCGHPLDQVPERQFLRLRFQHLDQNTAGIPGAAEEGDGWGAQVRLIDIDGDGRAELVAAAPDENAGDGDVWLLPASGAGLLAAGSRSYGAAALGGSGHGAHFGAVIDE
jgi:hypothetical protein